MTLQIQSPFQQFFDLDGDPLDNGSIYIGNSGQNPQQYPIPIFWDAAGTIPALQPVRTLNGYAVRNGTPARIFIDNTDYSITVKDSRDRVVYTALSVTAVSFNRLAQPDGSSLVGFIQTGAHAVARTVLDRGRDAVSIKDFANYSTNAAQAILDMAADYGFVRIPFGNYPIGTSITIAVPIWFDEGAAITAAGGVTVTINNVIESPRQFIFQGTGTYTLGHSSVTDTGENARQIHVSWFGAFPSPDPGPDQGPALQKAANAMGNGRESTIQLDQGNYNVDSTVTLTRGCHLVGYGQRRTVLKTQTDGFPILTTGETAVRISSIQFELHLGSLTLRTSPFITVAHDMCDIYDVALGNSFQGILITALRCRVDGVLASFGASPGAGSSLISIQNADCTVKNVYCMLSSAQGPESVIQIGGGVTNVGNILVDNIDSIMAARVVLVDARTSTVSNVMVRNIRYSGFTGNIPAAVVQLLTGSTFNMNGVIIDGVYGSSYAANNIKLDQSSTGTMSNIAISNVFFSGSNGGAGIAFNRTLGTMDYVTIASSVNVQGSVTPYSFTGNPSRIIFDPIAIPDAIPAVCYDRTIDDDQVATIVLNRSVFTGILMVTSGVANYAVLSIRAAPTPNSASINISANVATALTPLTGTTGTDGRLTIGITSGVLYIENRLGTTQRVSISLLTGVP